MTVSESSPPRRNTVPARVLDRSVQPVRERAEREATVLLRAARHVMARNGAAGMTVADVLEEAGLSTRAFYRHFASKDELVLAVYETEQRRSIERLVAAVDAAPDPARAVVAWIDENLSLAFDSRRAARTRTLATDGYRLRGEFPEHFDAIVVALLHPLVDAITRGVADGSFPHAHPEQDARFMHAVVWELAHQRLAGESTLTLAEARAHALRFCLGALTSPA
jgi:AcrR family transcriptional regulator